MCGRFALFDLLNSNLDLGKNFIPNYNLSPGSQVYILKKDFKIYTIQWSMKPLWSN